MDHSERSPAGAVGILQVIPVNAAAEPINVPDVRRPFWLDALAPDPALPQPHLNRGLALPCPAICCLVNILTTI
jgi:hypothetical protein